MMSTGRRIAGVSALALFLAAPLASFAQTGDSAPPTIAQVAWLAGSWQGTTASGQISEESTLPLRGGMMAGVFRLMREEKVLVLEAYSIRQTDEGVELRLRHYDALMEPASKNDPLVLRLVEANEQRAVFEGPSGTGSVRTTYRRTATDAYDAVVEITAADGTSKLITLAMMRVGER